MARKKSSWPAGEHMQSMREGNTVRVDRVVGTVRVAESERRVEVLRHRPEVTHRRVLALVRPRGDWDPRHALEHGLLVDRLNVSFEVAVAHAQWRAARSTRGLRVGWREADRIQRPDGPLVLAADLSGHAAGDAAAGLARRAGARVRTWNRLARSLAVGPQSALGAAPTAVVGIVERIDTSSVATESPGPAGRVASTAAAAPRPASSVVKGAAGASQGPITLVRCPIRSALAGFLLPAMRCAVS
jgi:hypothetical protein